LAQEIKHDSKGGILGFNMFDYFSCSNFLSSNVGG